MSTSTSTSTQIYASDHARTIAMKYLALGLILGLFLAPRAGAETWGRVVSSLQDLFGSLGGNEFTEPS